MELPIKQLKQNNQIFVPQTTSEAVLVKDNSEVITLDKLLDKKVENIITPANSGLQAFKQDKNIVLTHTNLITANETPSPIMIKHDSRGHIIETSQFGKLFIVVNNVGYSEYNGENNRNILLGDDFKIDENNNIVLNFNNI